MSLLFDPTTGELVDEAVVNTLPYTRKKAILSLQNPKPRVEITEIPVNEEVGVSENKNSISNHTFKIGIILLTLILGMILTFYLTSNNAIPPNNTNELKIDDLIGYYSAEQTIGNNHQSASAQIMDVNGNLNLRFAIPNYPPQDIPITIDLNNLKLETAHLGAGDIVFHRETNEIEIILKRESNIWILRK
jgi:hypothetical protein